MKAITLVAAVAAFLTVPAMAADAADKPPAKVAQVCGACHGVDGVAKMPMYPDLAGQYPDYIEQALHEYRNGERVNPIMTPMAKSLTPAEISEVAQWFSTRKPKIYTPDVKEPFVPPPSKK